MKKLFAVLAFAGCSLSGFAQDAIPAEKYSVATNSFWSNWFIQAGAEWNAWYSCEERGLNLSKSPFKKFRSNPGAALAIGKWFTPGIGLRTKLQGIWGKQVYNPYTETTGSGNKYWVLNEDVMFNLSNMLCGYSESRVWNVIPFVGAGVGRSMSHNLYTMDLSFGIQSSWKLSKHLGVYLEAGWNRLETDIDCGALSSERRGWNSHDNNIYAEVGLTFKLGKSTWKKTPDVEAINTLHQSELDALNARLDDVNAENERLSNLLKKQKSAEKAPAVKEVASTPVSVFFDINRSSVAAQQDLVNVQVLANYAKEHGSKLLVTGYADSSTGSAEFNKKLSEDRAQTVVDELVKMGVERSNITVKANGGVDELSPVSFNRRATVQIAE